MNRTIFLEDDVETAIRDYMAEQNEGRMDKLGYDECINAMLRYYENMRRRAWAAEHVLENIMDNIDQHCRRVEAKTLPAVDQEPNYPFIYSGGIGVTDNTTLST